MKTKNIILIGFLSTAFLALAFFDGFPYIYFQFLRWVITVTVLYLVYDARQVKAKQVPVLGVILAVFFQPIFPIHLDRSVWLIFDVLAILIIWFSIYKIYSQKKSIALKMMKPVLDVVNQMKVTDNKFARIDFLVKKENEVRGTGDWKEADRLNQEWKTILEEIEGENAKESTGEYPEGF